MKKLTLMALLLSLALVACGEKKAEEVKETATQAVEQVKEEAKEAVSEAVQKINFKTAEGETFTVDTQDLFETATLTNAAGEVVELKRDASADGIKLVGENTSIHFNDKEGVLTIGEKEYKLNVAE